MSTEKIVHAMCAMMPGLDKSKTRRFVHYLENNADSQYLTTLKFASKAFDNSPKDTIGLHKKARELDPVELDRHAKAFNDSPQYGFRVFANVLKLNASLCWGADDDVRRSFGLKAYAAEHPPEPNEVMHDRHISFQEQDVEASYDFVVVGSGPGGTTAALKLAEKGFSVAIVEAGPWRQPDNYPKSILAAIQHHLPDWGTATTNSPVWLELLRLLELLFANRIDEPLWPVLRAQVAGGTSVINSGISLQTPSDVFASWVTDFGLPNLEADIRKQEAILDTWLPSSSAKLATDIVAEEGPVFEKVLEKAPTKHGEYLYRFTKDCQGENSCFRGCPWGKYKLGKQSLDNSLLRKFVEFSSCRVYSCAPVSKVSIPLQTAKGVVGRFRHPATGRAGGDFKIKANQAVIIAASVIGSPVLLHKSGVGNHNIGKRFQAHPGSGVLGHYPAEVTYGKGPTMGWHDKSYLAKGFKLETLNTPLDMFAGRMPAAGEELMDLLREWKHFGVIAQACRAQVDGEIRFFPGTHQIRYKLESNDMKRFREGIKQAAKTHFDADADYVMPGIAGLPNKIRKHEIDIIDQGSDDPRDYQGVLSHLFGGCVMGTDASNSVCNADGKVHGYEGLYVTDASVLPSNLGVNPQRTIMANAMRIAEKICAGN